ncbi:MAG: transpeptidase family protein [Deltaproteobacteria bacterium]|nr:transpeptidase family protein [Deltaproteobacteria bacterium]
MSNKNKKLRTYRIKISLIFTLFIAFFSVICLRSYQLQILGNAKLNDLAKAQYHKKLTIKPKRGTIYDRNGDVLALDVMVTSIGIHPHLILDAQRNELISLLVKHTSRPKKEILQKLKSKRKFEWIERRIAASDGEKIEDKRFKGVQVVREYRRFYPNKHLAGQLLGAVGYDAKALAGLELSYDHFLRADATAKEVQRDARGRFFSTSDSLEKSHDVYLTLDRNVQSITEQALLKAAQKHKPKSAYAIVTDVDTGDILAMANYPSFNPNVYWKYPQKYWKNHAVLDTFEPGSTFKTVLMAAALQSGEVKISDRFFCENGSYRVKTNIIKDDHPKGWLDVKGILKVSSNIGVTKIAQKIGPEQFYNTIKGMGFGEKIDIGFVGELAGSLRHYKTWKDIEFSNIAFGQGLAVNGIQMAGAYGAMVNGGWYVKPSVVKRVVDHHEQEDVLIEDNEPVQILDQNVSDDLRAMLHSVTQEGGTAPQTHIDGYLSGGKTGTAQIFDLEKRAYADHAYMSSFLGFAPLNKPKYLIYVVFNTPKENGYYGGVVAGPVFKEIAEKSLAYAGITPEFKTHDPKNTKPENKLSVAELNSVLKLRFRNIEKDFEAKRVPDLRGLSLRKVHELLGDQGLSLKTSGSGVVVKQSPQPGSQFKQGQSLFVKLEHRS